MDIHKINITQNQKKIIILSCLGFSVFLLLWVLLYLPASKKIKELKSELILTEIQIHGVEEFLSGTQDRDEAIRLLKQREQYLSGGFPQKEEQGFRVISEAARKDNINVISLQSGSKTEFVDESGKQMVIGGKIASYLPMNLEVSCLYKDLVRYLSDLQGNLPVFISVESLNIKKDSQFTGRIRVSINFNLYLLI